jgi:hypothetical protein
MKIQNTYLIYPIKRRSQSVTGAKGNLDLVGKMGKYPESMFPANIRDVRDVKMHLLWMRNKKPVCQLFVGGQGSAEGDGKNLG